MSTQWIGTGAIPCPCKGCGDVVDYTKLHPSRALPYVVTTRCHKDHAVELTFHNHQGPPTARCLQP